MTPAEAAAVLRSARYRQVTAHEIYNLGAYLFVGSLNRLATLDGHFTRDQLMAIATWMHEPAAVASEYHRIAQLEHDA